MLEFLGGVVLGGVAGIALKDKVMGVNAKNESKQREIDALCLENEKISRRNKELERQVEDILFELNKVRKKGKDSADVQDELQDDLDRAKRELKNVRLQNDDLARMIKEYKTTCEALEAEISLLKQKIG